MRARLSEGYQPDWDVDLRYGNEGEQLVADFLTGMLGPETGRLTVEVKTDRKVADTGNIWIELECRRKDGWHDSGIRTSKADAWSIVFDETCFITISTATLRAIAEHAHGERSIDGKYFLRSEETDGSHPTRGVKLPLNLFLFRLRTQIRKRRAA